MANQSTRWDRIPAFGALQTDERAAAGDAATTAIPYILVISAVSDKHIQIGLGHEDKES